jgi:8-oxo-dGTP diphosphatase
MTAPVEVAVAVFLRPDGATLLARRPVGKVYAGYWEFPGGKAEAGESVADALRREIREELGVELGAAVSWITRIFTYPHATVRLHFYRVLAWRGQLAALEHDALSWERPESVSVAPLLPANGPVLRALTLPAEYAITGAGMSTDVFFRRLQDRLRTGLKLIQVREKAMSPPELHDFARRIVALARPSGARVLVNGDLELAHAVDADGVHLTGAQLRTMATRPEVRWCGASCHSADELRLAERLGADFAVLGPVRATPTHPLAEALGWRDFRAAVEGAALPVYALGGLGRPDLEEALSCGAHGVAMVRAAWSETGEPEAVHPRDTHNSG